MFMAISKVEDGVSSKACTSKGQRVYIFSGTDGM
jgi:hypothetical protein